MTLPPDPKEIESRAKQVRLLIVDVDGVLTDGRVTYLPDGQETKTFHVRDGIGTQLLIASGVRVALISGRASEAVTRRARELGIDPAMQGIDDKLAALHSIMKKVDVSADAVAYIGDDLPDLPIFGQVGLSMAVADAAPELRSRAHVLLRAGGGQGAVREACEIILRAKGAWNV